MKKSLNLVGILMAVSLALSGCDLIGGLLNSPDIKLQGVEAVRDINTGDLQEISFYLDNNGNSGADSIGFEILFDTTLPQNSNDSRSVYRGKVDYLESRGSTLQTITASQIKDYLNATGGSDLQFHEYYAAVALDFGSDASPDNNFDAIDPGQNFIFYTEPDDIYEENDSANESTSGNSNYQSAVNTLSTPGSLTIPNIKAFDDDWFAIMPPPPVTGPPNVVITVNFTNAQGNLDLEVYDSSEALIGSSASTTADNESVTISSASAVTYYIRVFPYDRGKDGGQTYSIDISTN